MSKAIAETPAAGEYFANALEIARRLDAGDEVPEADFHLGFASAAALFGELTGARMALLEALKEMGPVSLNNHQLKLVG